MLLYLRMASIILRVMLSMVDVELEPELDGFSASFLGNAWPRRQHVKLFKTNDMGHYCKGRLP